MSLCTADPGNIDLDVTWGKEKLCGVQHSVTALREIRTAVLSNLHDPAGKSRSVVKGDSGPSKEPRRRSPFALP